MAMHQVQLQTGLSTTRFIHQHSTEANCARPPYQESQSPVTGLECGSLPPATWRLAIRPLTGSKTSAMRQAKSIWLQSAEVGSRISCLFELAQQLPRLASAMRPSSPWSASK